MSSNQPTVWHMERKTAHVTLRLDARLKQAVQQAATEDQRSVSGLIKMLLADYCLNRKRPLGEWPGCRQEAFMISKRVQKATERTVILAEGGDTRMHKRQSAGPVTSGHTGKTASSVDIRPAKASTRNYRKGK